MHFPVILAHGGLLAGSMIIIAVAGAVGIVCLMFAYHFEQKKTPEGRRAARRFVVAVFACILLALFSPLVAQILHLP